MTGPERLPIVEVSGQLQSMLSLRSTDPTSALTNEVRRQLRQVWLDAPFQVDLGMLGLLIVGDMGQLMFSLPLVGFQMKPVGERSALAVLQDATPALAESLKIIGHSEIHRVQIDARAEFPNVGALPDPRAALPRPLRERVANLSFEGMSVSMRHPSGITLSLTVSAGPLQLQVQQVSESVPLGNLVEHIARMADQITTVIQEMNLS